MGRSTANKYIFKDDLIKFNQMTGCASAEIAFTTLKQLRARGFIRSNKVTTEAVHTCGGEKLEEQDY